MSHLPGKNVSEKPSKHTVPNISKIQVTITGHLISRVGAISHNRIRSYNFRKIAKFVKNPAKFK